MPNVEEWCDSVRHHTPEFGSLGDNEDLETGYEGATYDGDGLDVVKGDGSSRETRESQEGDDRLEYRYQAVEETTSATFGEAFRKTNLCHRRRNGNSIVWRRTRS